MKLTLTVRKESRNLYERNMHNLVSYFAVLLVVVGAVCALLGEDPQEEVALFVRLEGRRDD